MTTAAIEINSLTKDYALGFWRERFAAHSTISRFVSRTVEIFRFLGPERRLPQDNYTEVINEAHFSDGRNGTRSREVDQRRQHGSRNRLPARAALFLRFLTAREFYDYYARFFRYVAGRAPRTHSPRFLDHVASPRLPMLGLRKFANYSSARNRPSHFARPRTLGRPMSRTDPIGREVRDIILEQKQPGRAVFFSTHILSDAECSVTASAFLVDRSSSIAPPSNSFD